jgi:hypothetical protein
LIQNALSKTDAHICKSDTEAIIGII